MEKPFLFDFAWKNNSHLKLKTWEWKTISIWLQSMSSMGEKLMNETREWKKWGISCKQVIRYSGMIHH